MHVGRLFPTEGEARNAPRGDVLLAVCQSCGYIGNRAYAPVEDAFAPGYDASLHYSKIYSSFLCGLADDLIARYDLRNKSILEVACGPGFFLRLMLRKGCGSAIGVDPSLERTGADAEGDKPITWIRDFYDDRYADLRVDLVVCRQALHTMPNPRAMIESVRRAVGDRPEVRIYFEVVNADHLFRSGIVWQFLYEYRSYFTASSLALMFRQSGLDVLRVGPCYVDDQYLSIEAASTSQQDVAPFPNSFLTNALKNRPEFLRFAEIFHDRVSYWQNRLREFHAAKHKVIAWGAAGRGITFLNLTDLDRSICFIVDINPARQGKFVPGTGALVVTPESLLEYRPDVIILTNATYADEIKEQVRGMGLNCEFLLA
jgi:SAM-dependent methyltransferase